jgi:GR25 family glycosyltransferase involved in LPS biosynthesis
MSITFENIDKIFVINIKTQPERLQEFYDGIEKAGISKDQIETFNGIIPDPSDLKANVWHKKDSLGIIGCIASHLEVIKLAKARGYKNIMVFEDDFRFFISGQRMNEILNIFFNEPDIDWKVLMLGYNLLHKKTIRTQNISSIFKDTFELTNNVQAGSCYVLNSKYFDELIETFEYSLVNMKETGKHWLYACDIVWKNLQQDDKWFYSIERVGFQKDAPNKSW